MNFSECTSAFWHFNDAVRVVFHQIPLPKVAGRHGQARFRPSAFFGGVQIFVNGTVSLRTSRISPARPAFRRFRHRSQSSRELIKLIGEIGHRVSVIVIKSPACRSRSVKGRGGAGIGGCEGQRRRMPRPQGGPRCGRTGPARMLRQWT